MADTRGRIKTIVISLVMLVVMGAAAVYLSTEYGTNRAITVLVAVALIAALVWLILTVIGILVATSARRTRTGAEDDSTLRNEQRPVPRRAPIISSEDPAKRVGRRRKDPDA
ncbi:hypothetical protein GL325_10050 [Aeromicrobium sp. 636]|uniref:CvpA family protein n=1 Tax=Aeromicrobium senzhongii TaxID=2663859 RepID=A0A8I0EUH6_9ACTN|nr:MULTISPECIES: CvpA family protein [Aeromicrobium]MBC9226666.1 CvpA family protein [Aeromicrobium senzhongii]MCQ3998767.1 hypothetical protein [Aeromicrobium sp. 636]MTB89193.1 hypothetical protein [Aeromicrobium senzhongii]QNL93541.1 CvpA family protein [Aeromicrobium senzhongii]